MEFFTTYILPYIPTIAAVLTIVSMFVKLSLSSKNFFNKEAATKQLIKDLQEVIEAQNRQLDELKASVEKRLVRGKKNDTSKNDQV